MLIVALGKNSVTYADSLLLSSCVLSSCWKEYYNMYITILEWHHSLLTSATLSNPYQL